MSEQEKDPDLKIKLGQTRLTVNFQQLAATYQAQPIAVAAPYPILKSCV